MKACVLIFHPFLNDWSILEYNNGQKWHMTDLYSYSRWKSLLIIDCKCCNSGWKQKRHMWWVKRTQHFSWNGSNSFFDRAVWGLVSCLRTRWHVGWNQQTLYHEGTWYKVAHHHTNRHVQGHQAGGVDGVNCPPGRLNRGGRREKYALVEECWRQEWKVYMGFVGWSTPGPRESGQRSHQEHLGSRRKGFLVGPD